MTDRRSDTETIIAALDVLAREIHSNDGVANAALAEGAQRLRDMQRKVAEFRERKQEAETRERSAWLLRQAEARQFSEELNRLRAEVEALRAALADAEIADLRGQAVVLRRLLADALAVLRTIDADDSDEAERLESLCAAVALAIQPKREGALL